VQHSSTVLAMFKKKPVGLAKKRPEGKPNIASRRTAFELCLSGPGKRTALFWGGSAAAFTFIVQTDFNRVHHREERGKKLEKKTNKKKNKKKKKNYMAPANPLTRGTW